MFDFTFHNPTKIIFGAGKETLIGSELNAAESNECFWSMAATR